MRLNHLFTWLTDQIRNTEHALITFVAAVIPWLVPVIPAYLTGYHVVNQLELPEWAGWIIGAIIEGLGLASMSRTVAFWENNRKYVKDVKKMPIWIPLGTYVWYLAIVIVVNVLLEWAAGARPVRLWTLGLLATLSLPTAALISVNSIWTERLLERERQKEERQKEREKLAESDEESSETTDETSDDEWKFLENYPKDWRKLRPTLNDDGLRWFANIPTPSIPIIATKCGVSDKTIFNWRSYARAELQLDTEDI